MNIKRIELQEVTFAQWQEFLKKILRPDVMFGGTGDQPESDGLPRSFRDIVNVSDGTCVYLVDEYAENRSDGVADFHNGRSYLFLHGDRIMVVDTGEVQVMTFLAWPNSPSLYRHFSNTRMNWNPWEIWGTRDGANHYWGPKTLKLPITLEALEQQLRI